MFYEPNSVIEEISIDTLVDFLYDAGKKNHKVLFGLIKNLPVYHSFNLHVYFRNGVVNSYSSWVQFCEIVWSCGNQGLNINTVKMTRHFLDKYQNLEDRNVVVEYYIPMISSVQRYIDNPPDKSVKPEIDMKLVMKNSKDMPAKDFKFWLREYLQGFEVDYKVKMGTGVSKVVEELKLAVDKS